MKETAHTETDQAHWNAIIRGGLRGTLYAAAVAAPAHILLRRLPFYRSLPINIKAFGLAGITTLSVSLSAELASEKFSENLYPEDQRRLLDDEHRKEATRWQRLKTMDKFGDWAKRYKWEIIGGSWAAAMAGSFALVSRNSAMSIPQRLVQARVYAQAWTVLCLIAAGIASQTGDDGIETEYGHREQEDHSWREILDHNEVNETTRVSPSSSAALAQSARHH